MRNQLLPYAFLEFHLADLNDTIIYSNYRSNFWNFNGSEININLYEAVKETGFRGGKYKLKLRHLSNVTGTIQNPLYIEEISSSKKEIRVRPYFDNDEINASFLNFLLLAKQEDGAPLFIQANLSQNRLIRILNWVPDFLKYPESPYSVILKLEKELPTEIKVKDFLTIDYPFSEEINDTIIIYPVNETQDINILSSPNFNAKINNTIKKETDYHNWQQLVSTDKSVSNKIINQYFGETAISIDLNIDYRSFENFVYYSSAEKRLENFKYKLQKIESYNNAISSLYNVAPASASVTSSIEFINNVTKYNDRVNTVISSFDKYEKYLYYESGSYESGSYGEFYPTTWPKQSSFRPYTLAPTTSSEAMNWYDGIIESASMFDIYNETSLIKTIPNHIRDDEYSDYYVTFINLIAQEFDNVWLFVKSQELLKDRNESLYEGMSKDIVYSVLKSYGWDPVTNTQFEDLWQYTLGTDQFGNYQTTGSYSVNENIVFVNSESLSREDISKEYWKRIFNNLPLLNKTKGTKEGIRSLINIYGIPPTILRIKEYGGPEKIDRKSYDRFDKFTYALHFEAENASYVEVKKNKLISGPVSYTSKKFVLVDSGGFSGDGSTIILVTDPNISYPDSSGIRALNFSVSGSVFNANPIQSIWNEISINSGALADISGGLYSMTYDSSSISFVAGTIPIDSLFSMQPGYPVGPPNYWTWSNYEDFPWLVTNENPIQTNEISPNTIEFRFKTINGEITPPTTAEANQVLFRRDDAEFVIKLTHTDGIYGILSVIVGGCVGIVEQIGPGEFYNGEWWSVMFRHNELTEVVTEDHTFKFVAKQASYYNISLSYELDFMISGSCSSNLANIFDNGNYYIGGGPTLGSLYPFEGYMQEFRFWGEPLSEEAFDNHVLAPTAFNATNPTGSFDALAMRLPFGTDLKTYNHDNVINIPSRHPNQKILNFVNGNFITGSAHNFSDSNNYVPVYDYYSLEWPDLGANRQIGNKIRIEDSVLDGYLDVQRRVEKSAYDLYPNDTSKIGVYFSPTNEVNQDIAEYMGGFFIDDYIGAWSDSYKNYYPDMISLKNYYFKKYLGKYNVLDYFRLTDFFDMSLFRHIKEMLPARSNKIVGVAIEPHLLNRSKISFLAGDPTVIRLDKTANLPILTGSQEWTYINPEDAVIDLRGEIVKMNLPSTMLRDAKGRVGELEGDLEIIREPINCDKRLVPRYMWPVRCSLQWVILKSRKSQLYQKIITPRSGSTPPEYEWAEQNSISEGEKRLYYKGSRISSKGINYPTTDTPDGRAPVEVFLANSNQLFTKQPDNSTGNLRVE